MASKEELMNDERFRRITKDPRFWEMPEKDRKIKIDKRFRAMFHDKKFKLKYTVDKRGRPINHSSTEDLKRYYDLSDSDSDLSDKDSEASNKKKTKKKTQKTKKGDPKKLPDDKEKSNTIRPKEDFGHGKEQDGYENICKTQSLNRVKKVHAQNNLQKDEKESKNKGIKNQKEAFLFNADTSSSGKLKMSELDNNKIVKYSKVKFPKEKEKCDSDNSDVYLDVSESDESELEEDTEDDSETEDDEQSEDRSAGDDEEISEYDDEDDDESDSGPDLARGKGNIETSSEDEEDDMTEFFPKEPSFEHAWRELDKDAPRADEITRRLAVCNMDWDRLTAKDLLALFNSFKPKGGVIFSVKIYPSEFGKERMKEELVQGPKELQSIPEDAPEKDWTSREKLRDYQFKRLKYFYAVVDCDSPETASKIYEDCDGLEFESSCSFVDLRFIPDDITFDEEPKDIALEVDITTYKPKYFTSAAMGTSTVEITWDETDHERIKTLNRNFKKDELLDMDFQAYLASSSDDEEEPEEEQQGGDEISGAEDVRSKKSQKDDDEQITKYRQLLQLIQEKEKKSKDNDMEMEIKWVPGLKESAEEMVKNKLEGKDKLTPWEQFLEKKKEKKKLKKKQKLQSVNEKETSEDELPSDVDLNDPYFAEEVGKIGTKKKSKKISKDEKSPEEEAEVERQNAEMALLMMDDEDDGRKHFNYNKIVEQQNLSKKKKKKLMKKKELLEDDFEVDVSDTRFQAMYTSHLFNLDPSDPNFKKTKAVEKILEEKARQREQKQQELTKAIKRKENDLQKETAKKSIDPALSMLIKSIKNKTQEFQARKKQKVK
ncbi:ESF1 homolog [Vombatus ursinus]|uniref:ESF1 nucleolar pre-rRNA processing protein homolog n=1 Tax=Vombatus ursinus TaxID=29139 RepID=A0A4X2KJG2_VOMUR|nr:ESF1 homolog [Vombatus ursinus]XP_027696192.1 ESF1 homolog [Vombatus ursinus]